MKSPKNIEENKEFRLDMWEKAEDSDELKTLLIDKCREDDIFFIDTYCWTFDPRISSPKIPFILYPRQEAFIYKLNDCLRRAEEGEKINLVGDKPRAVGATFTFMAWCLSKYLFHNFTARIGSRKEDYVDKRGEPDTLFYKLDFMLERLPDWMKGKSDRASMILKKEGSENQISGESANPNFSRGGRKSVVGFDELSFWEWAKSSWESAGESTNFRIAFSTPPEAGRDSFFYKLLSGQKGRIEKFAFDWTDVPGRDNKWLKEQKDTKSDEEFSREVLKSYEGTKEGKVYASSLGFATIGKVVYNPNLPLITSWDFGLDQVAILWLQKDISTGNVFIIDAYHNSNKEIDFYIPFITGDIISGTYKYEEYEVKTIEEHRQWTKTQTHFGDPDVAKRNIVTKTSARDWLQKYGIYIQTKTWGGRTWKDMRDKTQMLFRRLHINEDLEYFISALRSARYPARPELSQATTAVAKPIHDWTSHFRTALEYFADNEPMQIKSSTNTDKALKSYLEMRQKKKQTLKKLV